MSEPTVTFLVEPWSQCWRELSALWDAHWQEVATHKDSIKLKVDMEAYAFMEARGMLHVVVARSAGKVVGYHLSFVRPHFHYADSLTGYVDVYFLEEAFRKGATGIKMFRFVEKSLRARGVQRIFTATKISHDKSALFERLGYKEVEKVFSKLLTPEGEA